MALFNLIGIGVGGLLGDRLGIVPVINIQVVACLAGGGIVLVLLRKTEVRSTAGDFAQD